MFVPAIDHRLWSPLLSVWLSLALFPDSTVRSQEATGVRPDVKNENWRRYRDGPLTNADFRGQVPAFRKLEPGGGFVPLTAYTFTEIRYDTRYRITGAGNRWTARLFSAEAFAVILRDRSWNRQPDNQLLLDHEQGHFDLTHSHALAVQLQLDDWLRARRAPIGTGNSSAAAIANLDGKLRDELKPLFDEHVTAQEEYDRVTRHGANAGPQEEERKKQLTRISEQEKKLAARKTKKSD